jgi:hypothetical protein
MPRGEEDAADRMDTLAKRVFGSRNRNGEPGGQHSQSYEEALEAETFPLFAETIAGRRETPARRNVLEELVKLLRRNTLELALIAPMLNIALVTGEAA